MTPSDDELERRLREAFAAKAHQVSPDDLDSGREAEFTERLTELSTARRKRRIFAGVGIVAAAAAAAGIVALADTVKKGSAEDNILPRCLRFP